LRRIFPSRLRKKETLTMGTGRGGKISPPLWVTRRCIRGFSNVGARTEAETRGGGEKKGNFRSCYERGQ